MQPQLSCVPEFRSLPSERLPRNEIVGLHESVRESATERQHPLSKTARAPNEAADAMYREAELRAFCCRIFGWADGSAGVVDEALHTLLSAAARGTAIALRGHSDLVPVAYALHRRLFGSERPFVVCDPRRNEGEGSVRSPPNRKTAMLALEAAMGGSVCLRAGRVPKDVDAFARSLREEGSTTTLFVCLRDDDRIRDLLCPPIEIPSLDQRARDLDRLLDEYLEDAADALDVGGVRLSSETRNAILSHVTSLSDLDKTALRLVALMSARNIYQAAQKLRMAQVSLTRWVRRRPWIAILFGDMGGAHAGTAHR